MIDALQAIVQLSPQRRALLAQRNPLSFSQQRLWFLEQLGAGGTAYNLPTAWRLTGRLDVAALRASLDEVVRRHEALRTSFFAPDGEPFQVVHKASRVALPVADLRQVPGAEREATARRLAREEAAKPFDLARGPLLRAALVRLADEEHLLLVTMHHIVSDGWSVGLFIREMALLYSAFVTGAASPLPAPPLQYSAYPRWQRGRLQGEVLEAELDYWRRQLAGAPPVLELPADRPRPRMQTMRGAARTLVLPPAAGEALRALGQQNGATLFVTLLAAFQELLGRITGRDDLVVGSPVANRTRQEFEDVIGLFLNTLVLRTDLSEDPGFLELVERVRRVVTAAQAHQELPFERLVEELQPERSLSHAPLVQTLFVLLVTPPAAPQLPGLDITPVESGASTARFDLTLSIAETPCGLTARLEYSTDLFDATTMDRLLGHYASLLAAVAARPALRLSELPLLGDGERHQLLVEWQAAVAPGAGRSVLDLFEEWAARDCGRTAVVRGEESLTYAELDRRANRLARHLRSRGVAAEELVGLCIDRSLDMMVALLGILKTGGAYLPLDPAYPVERLRLLVEDSGVRLLVTREGLAAGLLDQDAEILRLDVDAAGIARCSDAPPERPQGGDRLAYVLYTSGSTGRPKGVQISHASLANFLAAMRERPGLNETDTVLAVTTLSFDIAALELLLPLTAGARIVLVAPEVAAEGGRLAEAVAACGATVMQATPATWQLMLQAGWQGDGKLRVLCGGEALPRDLAEQLAVRGSSLWNLYGPTETTVWSAVQRVEPGEAVSIGRPVSDTEIHLLDRGLAPAAIGVPGELCIGGAGLSRGYLGRPDLTADRFIPHPAAHRAGQRLYRTGDLARRLPDGRIEFLGRLDHQVKLRGFRIELGEIEAVLATHPAISEAVTMVREDAPGDRRLVAYLVACQEPIPDAGELRSFLQQKLPAYMVPGSFVVLPSLPLTPNGKVDRRALPAPDGAGAAGAGFIAPRTLAEEELARIWAEVLGVERVGVESGFFELGGHSLLAARLMHRVRESFGVELPLHILFERSDVAGMAAEIARRRAAASADGLSAAPLPAIQPDAERRHEPFPLNDVQQAYWIGRSASFDLGNVASHSYTEIDLPGLDVERLSRALRRLVGRHDMLRAIVLPDGVQQILPEVPPYSIETTDLRRLPAREAEGALLRIRQEMSHQVLPTDRWPLFDIRASLLEGGRVRLHFSLDYLVADAWSIGIIFREVFAFYQDPGLALPPLELSFRDCVLAEAAQQASESHRRAEQYWRDRLADLPAAPELPLARSPESLDKPRFVRRAARLEADAWGRLKALGAKAGLTPSGLLLGAFAEILATWSKSPRFTINLTLFNRPPVHPQIQEVVGDFTSLTLLAVDAGRPGSFEVRARAVQEQLWKDLEHRSLSAVHVLRELARLQGRPATFVMPVVFTSTLGHRYPDTGEAGGGDTVYGITQTPQVWLDHQVTERGGALAFNWDAVEDLFPAELLDDMFAAYRGLLDRLLDERGWREAGRPWLPAAQLELRRRINDTAAPVSGELLHRLCAARAAECSDRPAVLAPGRVLTHGELDQRAERLGRRLRELGARPNRLVGVVMEKGWEQVVAVLAVLKAGAAYLPVDAALPAERVRHLLERGEVELVLTQPWIEERIDWPAGVARLWVEDEETGDPAVSSGEPLEPLQTVDALAYVIFTSGSTGQPKGVMIDHRGAVNTVLDVNRRFAVAAGDRALALSSLSFDLSVYDVFGLLAAGGAVVVPEAEGTTDPAHWLELMARHGVTVWNTVPALMEMLVQYAESRAAGGDGALPAGPRLVLLSGDWIPIGLPDRIRALWPGAEVVSLGGATEVSIWSILFPIRRVDPAWTSVPYGRPMANQGFHVLDERLEPSPVWVPGQLYIGGIGLAQGYWRDEEKTRASFFLHPATGERLYRTGDLGRYLPDGTIEFLGRQDNQVKVQGHRIELGEIETCLEQHPGVRAAAVVAPGSRSERRLVGFFVPAAEAPVTAAELREHLRQKLPAYMVPTTLVELEALPLTANGKVDRQALAMREAARDAAASPPDAGAAFAAPRTPIEEKLARLWSEVLGATRVGLHDTLFELGGNSLAAIRLVARIRDTFRVEIGLRALFQGPTVAGAAELVRKALEAEAQSETASLERYAIAPDPQRRHEPFPLNDVQHAYWIGRTRFFALGNVAAHGYAEFEAHGLDVGRLEAALRRLIQRHDMLRAVVQPDGRQQILAEVPPYRIETLDLVGMEPAAAQGRIESVRQRMSHQVLPTDRWPLFEVCALRLDSERVRLHVSIDILIVDAWSSRLLWRDLAAFYADPEAALAPLDLSFRDYVLAEIAFQESGLYRRSQSYWWSRLETLPPAPELPMVKALSAIETPRFVRRSAGLEPERWQRLKARGARAGLTPSALLLAAFADVLALWSKSPRFTLNLTLFNRLSLHPQVNEIVGDFTSLTLVAVDGSREGSFEIRARSLQEQLWEDLEHRHIGGVAVLRELARRRRGTPGALTPVVFTSAIFGDGGDSGDTGPARRDASLRIEQVYGISQTPQVWLDHQVSERGGALTFNWDVVEELFPEGLFGDLFGAYCCLLDRLADGEEAWGETGRPWLPPAQAERRAAINATAAPVPEGLLHTPFETWAHQAPE
ncbi:MAG TPA: amino acid adenylation domain-containing protein, partial [Thermoanaerobaculia bacterium]|nr:amino acid adenylation domain-containing protein [Thermoanaerobaculia bacterium]